LYRTFITSEIKEDVMQITVDFYGQSATIYHDEKELKTDNPLQELSSIIFSNIHIKNEIFAMHAAAVAYKNKAIVLTAPTGIGKTTLTTYLIHNGFDYITDDCVLIDKSSLSLIPYCNDIHLREGGMEVLKQHQILLSGAKRLTLGSVDRFVFTPKNCVGSVIALDTIIFVKRVRENAVQDITTAESMMELMKCPMTPHALNKEYLNFLCALSYKCCIRMTYQDMEFVASYLKENLAHGD